jgi:quercetin dioxygenase-like cupin family protein
MAGTLEVRIDGETHRVEKDHTLVIPPGVEHGFRVVGEQPARLLVFFPTLDPYSPEHTSYLEGSRPASATH